jgi:hypothetical protein
MRSRQRKRNLVSHFKDSHSIIQGSCHKHWHAYNRRTAGQTHPLANEQVLGLDVSVDNVLGVAVVQRDRQVVDVSARGGKGDRGETGADEQKVDKEPTKEPAAMKSLRHQTSCHHHQRMAATKRKSRIECVQLQAGLYLAVTVSLKWPRLVSCLYSSPPGANSRIM